MNINEYAKKIYEQNKSVGWWDDPNRCIYTTLQLVSTEIAEATEGERKDLMDDHLPHRKMGEVELADALIRVLDIGGRFEFKYTSTKPQMFITKNDSIGKQHIGLNIALCGLVNAWHMSSGLSRIDALEHLEYSYSFLISSIMHCGDINNYDIHSATDEKIIYNANRADHKRETRAKKHGKKF